MSNAPWNDWYQCMGHTYGTWLPGDPRGFRTRHHREHVDGDYRNPPPEGLYEKRYQRSKNLFKRAPVYLDPQQRRSAVEEFAKALTRRRIELLVLSIDGVHWHALVRCADHNPRRWTGLAKKESSHYLKRHGLALVGGLWAVRSECIPVSDREHQLCAFDYIARHARKGAAIWTFAQIDGRAPARSASDSCETATALPAAPNSCGYNLQRLMRSCTPILLVTFLLIPATARHADAQQRTRIASPSSTAPSTNPTNVLFNGWGLTPAGEPHLRVPNMPLKMVLSRDGRHLIAVCGGIQTGIAVVDTRTRQVSQFIHLPRSFNGVAFSRDGRQIYVTGGNSDALHVLSFENGKANLSKTVVLAGGARGRRRDRERRAAEEVFLTGIAVQPQTGRLFICNEGSDEVWIVNPETFAIEDEVRTKSFPHSCIFGAGGRYLYVSNWGDRSLTVIDTETRRPILRIPVGVRPNDMAVAPDGRLFVACAGDNTVHVINTRVRSPEQNRQQEVTEAAPPPNTAREIISTSVYPTSPEGSTPDGLAISPDGKTLYVANADNNDLAIVDISKPDVSRVYGFIPTGWYPTAVATDGKTIFVASGKGMGSRPNVPPQPGGAVRRVGGILFDHPSGVIEGYVSFIASPDTPKLAAYTRQVRANSPYTPETLHRTAEPAGGTVIPQKVGQNADCPIKHVLYIIKENRTYDQVLGDLKDANGKPLGNGDPRLCLFGEDVSPNHHELAREYVVLDNLYANSEVSVDGHSWCDGAMATDYRQRSWTVGYTGHGNLPGNLEMSTPTAGFLWDHCKRNGVSFKCYGEGAWAVPQENRGTWPEGRDKDRVSGWINDLHKAERGETELPQFMIMSLGEDHTRGTSPGSHTPKACVASNDLGIARIVEAASHSKFWNQMAIFIVEDDAQNGPDHVDAHRTVGLVISPWSRRGIVDSTPYTQVSMVRTMELILGMPPLTQYDAGATPMFNCFGDKPDLTPYTPRTPRVDVNAINGANAPGARASAKMDFDEYDEAPEDELNRILWAAVKGPDEPYPTPIHRVVFTRDISQSGGRAGGDGAR